jgi:cation:H+ antiporter
MISVLYLLGGLVIVTVGAELLVKGAARGAATLGMSPLVVGLTVVAFGTSAPEVALSLFASLEGQTDLALGNVVGSNAFNLLFIIGVSALLAPLTVARDLVRYDVPVLIASSIVIMLMSLDSTIGWIDGGLLGAFLLLYVVWTIKRCPSPTPIAEDSDGQEQHDKSGLWRDGALLIVGLVLLTLGAKLLVMGGVEIAKKLGLSELVIGLTILAAGTSVPEIATSVVAALRGQRDIAVGNAVGSSIFNILFVLSAAALASPNGVPVNASALYFDMPVMIATSLACFPLFYTGYRIDRWEGALLLAYYLAYISYLILAATEHVATQGFGQVMLYFLLPLTFLVLAVLLYRSWRRPRARPNES